MPKFLVFFFASLLLVGCSLPGTQTESESTTEGTIQYTGSGFSMTLPKAWTSTKSSDIPTPHYGTLMLAYMSPDVKYGFANNIVIMKDTVMTPITSTKYSELNHLQTTKNYLEYTKLQDDPIVFTDSDTSRAYVFEARYNTTTPRMKFIQTAKACGTDIYLLHVTISIDRDAANYIDLLETFQCK